MKSEFHGIPLPLPVGTKLVLAEGDQAGYGEITVEHYPKKDKPPWEETIYFSSPVPYSLAPTLLVLASHLKIPLLHPPLQMPELLLPDATKYGLHKK
jgi:hypothetical protein